jgi:hypothetical protein
VRDVTKAYGNSKMKQLGAGIVLPPGCWSEDCSRPSCQSEDILTTTSRERGLFPGALSQGGLSSGRESSGMIVLKTAVEERRFSAASCLQSRGL